MGNFLSDIFGTTSESKTTQVNMTQEQQDLLKKLIATYSSTVGTGSNVYQGDRVAGLTDLQKSTISGAGNYTDLFSTPQTASTPLFTETGTALSGLLSGQTGAQKLTGQNLEDYYKNSIYNPAMKTLNQDTLPQVDESYAGPGFFDNARSKARVQTAQDTADWLGQQRSDLEWNNLLNNQSLDEARAGRTQTAVNQGMQYSQLPAEQIKNNLSIATQQVEGLGDLFGFGQAEQTQEQAELTAAMTKFAEENQITDPTNLATLLSLLGMSAVQTTTSTSPSAFANSFSSGAGTAANAGMWSGLAAI